MHDVEAVDKAAVGRIFRGSLENSIQMNGQFVVPRGADVTIRLANASSATSKSGLGLELVRLDYNGKTYPLVTSKYSVPPQSHGKDKLKATLGCIGGILGGRKDGCAEGARGATAQPPTGGKEVQIPAETRIDFTLEQPVSVEVVEGSATADAATRTARSAPDRVQQIDVNPVFLIAARFRFEVERCSRRAETVSCALWIENQTASDRNLAVSQVTYMDEGGREYAADRVIINNVLNGNVPMPARQRIPAVLEARGNVAGTSFSRISFRAQSGCCEGADVVLKEVPIR